jgi:type III pantothenate kinase
MSDRSSVPLIAVDIGNSRIKIGWFDSSGGKPTLPVPAGELALADESWHESSISRALQADCLAGRWSIASVNRTTTKRLLAWLDGLPAEKRPREVRELFHRDLALEVRVPEPDKVGIDRLLAAVATNRLRDPGRAAIIIDLGSAMTFDVVSADGAFLGGAILPGVGMSARALDEFTDLLPRIPMDELAEPPPALGTSTIEAMRSGLYWGAVGAMRELVARLGESPAVESRNPQVFLTGGAAPIVAQFLPGDATYVPHLVLGGIALVAGL